MSSAAAMRSNAIGKISPALHLSLIEVKRESSDMLKYSCSNCPGAVGLRLLHFRTAEHEQGKYWILWPDYTLTV